MMSIVQEYMYVMVGLTNKSSHRELWTFRFLLFLPAVFKTIALLPKRCYLSDKYTSYSCITMKASQWLASGNCKSELAHKAHTETQQ